MAYMFFIPLSMASWTSFYVHTTNAAAVVEALVDLTDDMIVTHDVEFPNDMGDYDIYDLDLPPTYIAVGNAQTGWTVVVHNSFDKMEDWGEVLSKKIGCKVIVTIAQSVSSAYYFALYENGVKAREIETCYSTDFDEVNYGQKFAFEGERPGHKSDFGGEELYMFDFEDIETYCRHFNLEIQFDYSEGKWTVLKSKHLKKESVTDYLKRTVKKPWWMFWQR